MRDGCETIEACSDTTVGVDYDFAFSGHHIEF